ncbi:MAG: hypothetical protein WC007_16905 [Pelobacteraceae bacterium]
MKKSLLETNPYLKDPVLRRKMMDRSIISSSAIEGIHITEEDLQRFREERAIREAKEKSPDSKCVVTD